MSRGCVGASSGFFSVTLGRFENGRVRDNPETTSGLKQVETLPVSLHSLRLTCHTLQENAAIRRV
jgi:hypothetical protein